MKKTALTWTFLLAGVPVLATIAPRYNTNQGQHRQVPPPTDVQIKDGAKRAQLPPVELPDEWLPYINPAFEEFWSEGNHKPDAGFVLFARDPSVENAKLYLMRGEIKARYLKTMLASVETAQRELVESGHLQDRYNQFSKTNAFAGSSGPQSTQAGYADTIIYFLFRPNDANDAAAAELNSLAGKYGLQVYPLQIRSGQDEELHQFAGMKPSDWASEKTQNKYVSSEPKLPVALLYDKRQNVIMSLSNITQARVSAAMLELKRRGHGNLE